MYGYMVTKLFIAVMFPLFTLIWLYLDQLYGIHTTHILADVHPLPKEYPICVLQFSRNEEYDGVYDTV